MCLCPGGVQVRPPAEDCPAGVDKLEHQHRGICFWATHDGHCTRWRSPALRPVARCAGLRPSHEGRQQGHLLLCRCAAL